ncbi:hypothetical protein [Sphingopyxis sp.]|uniref:hypothetical protein n=1 Tax=Sphingopyxis sp. TaxID=1908224 RepID=UPI003D147E75
MDKLHQYIVAKARTLLPREGEAALRQRQRLALAEAQGWLRIEAGSREANDLILLAERLRLGAGALDRITGRAGVDDMLDVLFRALLHRKMMFHVKHRIGRGAVDSHSALR